MEIGNFDATRWRPALPAVGVVVVLTLLTAATSHTSVWAPAREGVADPLTLLATVALSFGICGAVAATLSLVLGKDRAALRAWLPGAVVTASMLSLYVISGVDLHPDQIEPGGEVVDEAAGRQGVPLESDWRGPATRRGGEEAGGRRASAIASGARLLRRLVLIGGILSLGLLLASSWRWGGGASGDVDPDLPDDAARVAAHGAVVGTIAAMLADPDPRTAIIGAYARLQEELEFSGASREQHEGPTEHLHRVLSVLDVRSSPLQELIGLFEVARFSDHSVTMAHREAALAALREVARDLSVPSGATLAEGSGT